MIIKSIKSFKFAFLGLYWLVKSENNARIHAIATTVVILSGIFLKIHAQDWRWISLCIALVWITEAINTAIEKMVDNLSPGYNAEAGKVKDLAAGAVLIAAVFSLICGVQIFIPYFKNY